MNQKEFQQALWAAEIARDGYVDNRGLELVWSQGRRKFTQADVETFLAYRAEIDARRAARPSRQVFDAGAGDGFGLWKTVNDEV